MANKPLDTAFVDKALRFAVDAHAGTERRGKGFPYVIHPFEVVSIVATMTSDPELLAAAALHDTVEDTDVEVSLIEKEFGRRVADIVRSESDEVDPSVPESLTWHARKKAAITRLSAASRDAKIVALGDKLSNMRAIWRDYKEKGDELWKIFHITDKISHEWHYRGLADSLSELRGTFAYEEFTRLIDDVFGSTLGMPLHYVNLDDYVPSGAGFTAQSYNSKDGRWMIKLYSDFVPEGIPVRELQVAKEVAALGFKTPQAGRLLTDGKRRGSEFRRVPGKVSFFTAVSREPYRLEEFARRFAEACRKLHSTPCNKAFFKSAVDIFKERIKLCPHFTDTEKLKMLEFVYSLPRTDTCLHGDLHMGNIITNGEEDFWIDLGDFSYGNPYFDLGMFYLTCNMSLPDMAMEQFHNDKPTLEHIWEVFAGEYFGEGADMEEITVTVKKCAALMFVYFCTRDRMYPFMREIIEKNLLR